MALTKHRGLGRGLDALLGGEEAARTDALATLPVGAIRPGKYQPRTRMDSTALGELAASIKTRGLMQPVLVRPLDRERYEHHVVYLTSADGLRPEIEALGMEAILARTVMTTAEGKRALARTVLRRIQP